MRVAVDAGALLLDGRSPEEFAQGHLRGAVNVALDGRYAEFAGSVIPPDTDIVLVIDHGQELEGKNRLARIGFDRVIGYLEHPKTTMAARPTSDMILPWAPTFMGARTAVLASMTKPKTATR